MSDLEKISSLFDEQMAKVKSKEELQNLKTDFFGKNGKITLQFKTLRSLNEKNAYISIGIGLFAGFLFFPSPDFSKSILIGVIFSIDTFPSFFVSIITIYFIFSSNIFANSYLENKIKSLISL